MTEEPDRCGMLSTGGIAAKFVEGLRALPDAQMAPVGSRTREAAESFGAKHTACGRYSPRVDIREQAE